MSNLVYIFGMYKHKSVNQFDDIMIINYILITYWLFKKIFLSSDTIKNSPFFCPYPGFYNVHTDFLTSLQKIWDNTEKKKKNGKLGKNWQAYHLTVFCLFIIYLFLERRREGEREGEKHQCVVASQVPSTGDLGPQPRHVP